MWVYHWHLLVQCLSVRVLDVFHATLEICHLSGQLLYLVFHFLHLSANLEQANVPCKNVLREMEATGSLSFIS